MWIRRLELVTSLLLTAAYLTNKYVLSILKFTYPTLFQGWQTIVGTLLLQVAWKLGWVEMRSSYLWSAKISWLPGVLIFVGSIYAGSRALSKLPIPFFFMLQNASEVIANVILKIAKKEKLSCTKISSMLVTFTATTVLLLNIFKYESGSFSWAVIHIACAGGYKVFQKLKSCSLSMVLLICAAYPSGDAFDVLTFPFLNSYQFHSGCCASGILGVSLQLVSVKLKNCVSTVRYGAWILVTKMLFDLLSSSSRLFVILGSAFSCVSVQQVLAACLSLAVFETVLNIPTGCCLTLGLLGEALLVYTSISEPDVKG